jgi:dihydroorotate dehydrogenase (NAD+) catalytic subunit
MAGTSAIQIGTINFTNPRAGVEIIEGIEEFMYLERIESIMELVGAAL